MAHRHVVAVADDRFLPLFLSDYRAGVRFDLGDGRGMFVVIEEQTVGTRRDRDDAHCTGKPVSWLPRVVCFWKIGRPQTVTARQVETDKTSSAVEGDDRVAGNQRCRQGPGKRTVDSSVGCADVVSPVLLARVGIERDDDDRVVRLIHRDRGPVDDADAGVSATDRTRPADLQGERPDVGEDTQLQRYSVDVRTPKPALTCDRLEPLLSGHFSDTAPHLYRFFARRPSVSSGRASACRDR